MGEGEKASIMHLHGKSHYRVKNENLLLVAFVFLANMFLNLFFFSKALHPRHLSDWSFMNGSCLSLNSCCSQAAYLQREVENIPIRLFGQGPIYSHFRLQSE